MNILLFVTSLLMILSLLTYARIDNYRYFLGIQSEFELYMNSIERVYINNTAEKWYKTSIAKGRGQPVGTPPTPTTEDPKVEPAVKLPKNPAEPDKPQPPTSRLSIKVLFDEKMQTTNPAAFHQTHEWLKSLIKDLYSDQLFYRRISAKHSDFVNELLATVEQHVKALPEDGRPKKAADLANLELEGEFKDVFYLMLKGCPKKDQTLDILPREKEKKPIIELPEGEENAAAEEADDAEEAEEYSSPQGYDSLLNYISMRNTTKIRVYLASRELLTAIFGQVTIADQVIATRNALYKMVSSNTLKPDEAAKQFQSTFQGTDTADPQSMLDFKVTKTNPSDYD